ncbi:unnamed protein product [Ceratitis capitata]|uniref:(Mediterranean fruit fly) hypothetical protein n=1 Tax=Ceratitis capitata TaxID=7213 RepID=A0A811UGI1_CERCA|nr:unnamed protein product [Ceratitis capitata]
MSDPFFRPWVDKEKVEAAEPPLAERHINEQQQQQQREQNRLMIDPSGSQQRAPIEQAMVENGSSENKFASQENNQNTINTPEPPPAHTSQTTSKTAHETVSTSAASATVKNENGDIKLASKENTENNINTPEPPPAHTLQKTSKTAHETMSTSETSASLIPLSLVLKRPYFTSPNHLNEPQVVVVTLPLQRTTAHSGCTKSLKKNIVPTMSSPLEAASAPVQTKAGEGLASLSNPNSFGNNSAEEAENRGWQYLKLSALFRSFCQQSATTNTTVREAITTARKAITTAREAITTAREAITPVREAIKTVREAITPVREAITPVREAIIKARGAITTVREAITKARETITTVREAITTVREAITPAREAITTVREAIAPVREAITTARGAIPTAREAITTVREAITTVREAITTVHAALYSSRYVTIYNAILLLINSWAILLYTNIVTRLHNFWRATQLLFPTTANRHNKRRTKLAQSSQSIATSPLKQWATDTSIYEDNTNTKKKKECKY